MEQIIITGLPRSGTTLLGNLLGSCENVEYFFEPPLMNIIMNNLSSKVDEETWKGVYEEYRNYELMYESLAGRRINFNSHDDTYVYKLIVKEVIEARQSKSWRSFELENKLQNFIFCFKTPGLGTGAIMLQKVYPEAKFITLLRDIPSVIKSIKVKGWFDDTSKASIRNCINYNGIKIPEIISKKHYRNWQYISEEQRIILYIYYQYKTLRSLKNLIFVDFNELTLDSHLFYNLSNALKLKTSTKTETLLKSIKPMPAKLLENRNLGKYIKYFELTNEMHNNFLNQKSTY
jgi:hypothetical protein